MKKHFKYLFFLLAAIVCFILSQYFNNHHNTTESSLNQNKELQRIQSRITKKLLRSIEEAQQLQEKIKENNPLTFKVLSYNSTYPYYIYKSDQLIFWSSNSIVPPTSIHNDTAKFSYIEIRKSKFIKQLTQVIKPNGEVYKIYFLIPLYTKSFIQNQYLSSKFNKDFFESNYSISILPINKDGIIYSPEGIALFSLFLNPFDNWNNINNQQITFTLFLFYLLFLNVLGILWINQLLKQKKYFLGLLSIGGLIVLTRVNLLIFDFPYAYLPFDTFNAKFFASSIISTSIGDFFLNAVGVLLFSIFLFRYFFQLKLVRNILALTRNSKIVISTLLIIASQGCMGIVYSIFQTINQHSQWVFDITSSLQLNSFQIISVASFIAISISFFCINHILIRLYIALHKNDWKLYFLIAILGTIITPIIFWKDRNFYWPILIINFIFIALQFKLQMPRLLSRAKYSSYLYFIAVSMMCSFAGAIAINKIYNHRIIAEKLKFAFQTISESDILEEYLLKDIHYKITNDIFIKNNLSSPISNKELIIQKIRRVFMANYLEKYDVKISVYSPTGESYFANEEFLSYNSAIKSFAKIKYATEHKNIFYINESSSKDAPKFVIFNTIEKRNTKLGFILVQFLNKKIIPYSVFPELFIDKKYSSLNQPKTFSYAIFKNKEIEVNYGTVNYEKIFSKTYLEDLSLYEEGIKTNNLHHIAYTNKSNNTTIVVSSESNDWLKILSNFSLLFIIHLFCISIFIILFKYTSSTSIALVSYATKIQIYLNLSFFLPLIVITITTISIISKLYQKNLDEDFAIKAKNIGNNLSLYFEEFKNEKVKKKSLNTFINQLSKYTETDINFYNNQGVAIATNQPLFFQKEILSPYLHPEVWIEIKERKNNMTMQSESIGTLNYHSVYIAIKEYNTGNLLGIIGIPFFESKQELERQMIEVFTTIINIFSLLFIIFLILSYILSNNLTTPLKIITFNIKKTTLGHTNEKIIWNTQDEIGLLISAYNQMLEKLEISKEALKNSEKEKAWREMAQQVAHEIKNPLTPMKLTIQYLNQNILLPNDTQHQKISKGLETIHQQIELLNEIATSFSNFAKMPLPQLERIELRKLITNSVDLFKNAHSELITIYLPKEEYYINGDAKLLNGIFSNLFINAIQSIPNDRNGVIEISTKTTQQKIQVIIKDNGVGIPEEIKDKIFLPHFSTKFSGSGIGLSLAKQGIEYMGGKIWFESTINIGTIFYIEFPLTE